MPVSNISKFVGREQDLAAVETLLSQNSQVNIAAAVGMGGVGKTELAWQYARRRGNAFPGGVCWLRGVEPIAPQMISFAQDYLNLQVPEQTESPVAWCCQRWPGEGTVLMVVDDVQDYGALRVMLPSGGMGDGRFRVLLTTRQAILPVGQRLALEVLLLGAALELLANLVGSARIETQKAEAEELCEWVGRLPLGIELVGWHLQQRPELSVAMLLERLEGKRLAAKALMRTHPEMTAKLGVAAAFEVSWEPLSEAAKTLSGLLGLFAAAPIAWEWVAAAWAQAETAMDEEDLEEAQAELLRVNLLQKVEEPQKALRYRVHPLVREFFAVKRGEIADRESLQRGFAVAMTELAKTIPQTATVAVRTQVTDAVRHFEEVALRWTAALEGLDKTWCCIGLGRFYESLSQWGDAERWRQRAVEISKAELGDRHPSTATSLNNLALLYESQGRYSDAEPLYLDALAIRKAELGDRHPDTALGLNNLAALYDSQGRYSEAEPLYREALEIYKTELGDRHPDTALGLNNLAALYNSQGRYSEAEPLYREALEIRKTELGDRHPYTATSLNNLALLYESQGRYSDAEPLYLDALAIRKAELGDRHPSTATSLNNLAALYESQGRYSDAEPLYLDALAISKAELGDRHPDTALSLNNLAWLYYNTNRLPEAATAMSEALSIREEQLGPDHPYTVGSKESLETIQQAINQPVSPSGWWQKLRKALRLSR
ncbi:MAG: tetratricopeptide repeat protein [Cyanobacteria bacterium P01_D01_bin.1]